MHHPISYKALSLDTLTPPALQHCSSTCPDLESKMSLRTQAGWGCSQVGPRYGLPSKLPVSSLHPSLLSDLFQLQDFDSNPRDAILLDLYFYTIRFCRKHNFNQEQTSAFFSIVKDTHEACVGKVPNKRREGSRRAREAMGRKGKRHYRELWDFHREGWLELLKFLQATVQL